MGAGEWWRRRYKSAGAMVEKKALLNKNPEATSTSPSEFVEGGFLCIPSTSERIFKFSASGPLSLQIFDPEDTKTPLEEIDLSPKFVRADVGEEETEVVITYGENKEKSEDVRFSRNTKKERIDFIKCFRSRSGPQNKLGEGVDLAKLESTVYDDTMELIVFCAIVYVGAGDKDGLISCKDASQWLVLSSAEQDQIGGEGGEAKKSYHRKLC